MIGRQDRQANASRGWIKRRAREAEAALMTIQQAAAAGIDRVRDPRWQGPMDHVKIDIFDGRPGPWLHLFSPMNATLNGRDPVDVLITNATPGAKVLRYDGPLPDSDAYRAEVAQCASVIERSEQQKREPR